MKATDSKDDWLRVNLRFCKTSKLPIGFFESLHSKRPYERAKWLRDLAYIGWGHKNGPGTSTRPKNGYTKYKDSKLPPVIQPQAPHTQTEAFEEAMQSLDKYI